MFIIIWEDIVAEGQEARFEKIYGIEGDWAQLFRQGEGYLGTDLFRHMNHPRHYITIDRWASFAAFDSFRENCRRHYEALDTRCEYLTERETEIATGNLILST
jgi:heme-degrading monooxygenase HmoA